MNREIIYTVNKDDNGLPVRSILKKLNLSGRLVSKLKREENGILLNGTRAKTNAVVFTNDIIKLNIDDSESSKNIYPVNGDLTVVYEDDDILLIDKPPYLPCHPSKGHIDDSLANRVAYYYKEQGTEFVFRCVTRIDKNTSGLVLIAKNMLAHAALSRQFVSGKLKKIYYAVSDGVVTPEKGEINADIRRVPGIATIRREVCEHGEGERAITYYEAVDFSGGKTLIKVSPVTGRTHQIRVHLAHLGYPITGDFLYGKEYEEFPRQLLHCAELYFLQPVTEKELHFISPLPKDFPKQFTTK